MWMAKEMATEWCCNPYGKRNTSGNMTAISTVAMKKYPIIASIIFHHVPERKPGIRLIRPIFSSDIPVPISFTTIKCYDFRLKIPLFRFIDFYFFLIDCASGKN